MQNKILFTLFIAIAMVMVSVYRAEGALGIPYKYYKIVPGQWAWVDTGNGVSGNYKIGDNIVARPEWSGAQAYIADQVANISGWTITKNSSSAPVESNSLPNGISLDSNGRFVGVAQKPTPAATIPVPAATGSITNAGYYNYTIVAVATMKDGTTQSVSANPTFRITPPPCNPQISSPYFSEDYKNTTLTTRGFTPKLPINPFDDLVIDIDLTNCLTTDIFTPSITTVNALGATVNVLSGSNITGNSGTYQWKISGWPNGITTNGTAMEVLIDSIIKGRPINIELKKNNLPIVAPKNVGNNMSRCVRIYGNGLEGITYLREQGIKSIPDGSIYKMVTATINNVDYFNSKAPFSAVNPVSSKLYKDKFRHTLDLREFVEPTWRDSDINDQVVFDNFFTNIDFNSPIFECGIPAGNNQFFSSVVVGVTNFLPSFQSRGATVGSKVLLGDQFFYPTRNYVLFHELGHAFGKLADEYIYPTASNNFVTPPKNCSADPQSDFSFGNPPTNYAPSPQLGCHALKTNPPGVIKDVFRSSIDSIMNEGGSEDFNVISCGWILSLLNNASASTFFPECAAMSGVVK